MKYIGPFTKKIIALGTFIVAAMNLFSLDYNIQDKEQDKPGFVFEESDYAKRKWNIPAAKRPKKISDDDLDKASLKDEKHNGSEYIKKCRDTFKYGLETEVTEMIDQFMKDEEHRFGDDIYDMFQKSKNPQVKQKCLEYFMKAEDPCLEDYAVEILNDPYDQKKDTVDACFKYVSKLKTKEAIPALVELIDKEDVDYFDAALNCIGEVGGSDEAVFLSQFIEREDLTVPQKQQLVRMLGKIGAIETYDKLEEIATDENENGFMRAYAAEAIGNMKKEDAKEVLYNLFEEKDPNIRSYVVKGLSNFDDETTNEYLLQAIKDSHRGVRLEAINCVNERKMTDAVPYLIYRCKDKAEEAQVKNKCYDVLANLATSEANEYLVSIITDKKIMDATKLKSCSALMKAGTTGTKEILQLADECLKDDRRKPMRYGLGKEFAKYSRSEYSQICLQYLENADVATQGTGLDIYAKGKYSNCRSKVELIASEDGELTEEEQKLVDEAKEKKLPLPKTKKANANSKKAKTILERVNSYKGSESNSSSAEK